MNTTPFGRPRGFGFGPTIVQHQQNHPDALNLLRWRYARGEIGRDEFIQGTSDLTGRGEAPPPPEPPSGT
jgi:hypothetical protein